MRLDKFLLEKYPEFTRSKIQNLIQGGFVQVNKEFVSKNGLNLKETDKVWIDRKRIDSPVEVKAEKFDFEVLYEDKDCLVINKPAGVVVHPGDNSNMTGTVANALLSKLDFKSDGVRSGIVHRLDKNTSGALVLAKTLKGCEDLIAQFKNKNVVKKYLTLVIGRIQPKEGSIDAPIGRSNRNRKKMSVRLEGFGKKAVSNYKLLKSYEFEQQYFSLLEVQILTGRTHQIRVHMSEIGYPVFGDEIYGKKSVNALLNFKRQFLHAKEIEFTSPDTQKKVKVDVPLPKDLNLVLKQLTQL
ncbi:MAG: RluA family pseudouridine synthase [Patescibacteria group bacterium]